MTWFACFIKNQLLVNFRLSYDNTIHIPGPLWRFFHHTLELGLKTVKRESVADDLKYHAFMWRGNNGNVRLCLSRLAADVSYMIRMIGPDI